MKNLLKKILDAGMVVLLPLVLVLGAMFPGNSQGIVRKTTGDQLGEGDPVDGNDYGSDFGGGSDDDLHSDAGIDPYAPWNLPVLIDGFRIIVVPDLKSGTVFFHIITEDTRSLAEGIDAR